MLMCEIIYDEEYIFWSWICLEIKIWFVDIGNVLFDLWFFRNVSYLVIEMLFVTK